MLNLLTHSPWAILLIIVPLAAALLCVVWPSFAKAITQLTCSFQLFAVFGFYLQLSQHQVFSHSVGGWGAPLGIELYADGLSLLMLLITALCGLFISIYSGAYFKKPIAEKFWPLFLFLICALNALFLSADIFNFYVCLELIALSAVALSALSGTAIALRAAMRYLLATLLGSMLFLLGVALLYHSVGSVDIQILATRLNPSSATWAALALITCGLLLKTALFPFHFWLPPAHSSAPAPVSALLSALVVKASFYILLRIWLAFYSSISEFTDSILATLGAGAILWGSIQALRQTRLKLLIAYSTVAQIGYLFLAFALGRQDDNQVWFGVAYLALSHALAKSAMFMAAGNLLLYGNHDRITDLDRVVQRLPVTAAAFALAGVSIIGLPPSGGFIGKWLILETAINQQQWWVVCVMLLGGLLAAAYIFKVLGHAFTEADNPIDTIAVPMPMQWSAFILAACAIALGFMAPLILPLLDLGQPFTQQVLLP